MSLAVEAEHESMYWIDDRHPVILLAVRVGGRSHEVSSFPSRVLARADRERLPPIRGRAARVLGFFRALRHRLLVQGESRPH
jgi:hypothetical protein